LEAQQTNSGPNVYLAPVIEKEDEIDGIKKAVYLFSAHRKVSGTASKVLREKLILLLAIYVKYGYSKEIKEMASKVLNVEKPAINSMNLELRSNDYLVTDKMNTRINHLNSDLEMLQEYMQAVEGGSIIIVFQIK
jgi:hypothetical protein